MTKTVLPEIRIKDAWLFRENVSVHLNELWGNGKKMAPDEWYEKRAEDYSNEWKKHEEKVLTAMCTILDTNFKKNIVDVYIAPWINAFSDPLIIGVMREPDEFIDTLTHELLHVLLTDNTSKNQSKNRRADWQKLFGKEHSFKTLVHIPVHSVHKQIYLETFKNPKRLEHDINLNKQHKAVAYLKAWDFVEKEGYKKINQKLREYYAR